MVSPTDAIVKPSATDACNSRGASGGVPPAAPRCACAVNVNAAAATRDTTVKLRMAWLLPLSPRLRAICVRCQGSAGLDEVHGVRKFATSPNLTNREPLEPANR